MSPTEHKPLVRPLAYGGSRLYCSCGGWHEDDGGSFMEHIASLVPADIAIQLPGYVVLRADVATTLIRILRDAGLYGIADQIEAQTRLPEPPPVSNERAAQLIRYHCEQESISRADSAELLRFADQLEAE